MIATGAGATAYAGVNYDFSGSGRKQEAAADRSLAQDGSVGLQGLVLLGGQWYRGARYHK